MWSRLADAGAGDAAAAAAAVGLHDDTVAGYDGDECESWLDD